jgi:hypothetical protein
MPKNFGPCPLRVKTRKHHGEHMFSGLPPRADAVRRQYIWDTLRATDNR